MKAIEKTLSLLLILLALASCASVGVTESSSTAGTEPDGTLTDGELSFELTADGTLSVCAYSGSADTLELPQSVNGVAVSAISAFAFEDCASLEKITIPDGVTSVGSCAFAGCTSLRSITFPAGLVDITRDAVEGTPYYDSLGDGAVIINGTLIDYRDGGESEHITLPDGIVKIAARAMSGREALVSVTLPDGVKEIGERAFARCTSLQRVDMPSSVCSVGIGAFENTGLFSSGSGAVVLGDVLVGFKGNAPDWRIPSGVRAIASGAFIGCTAIAVSVPDGVTTLCDYAFWGLDSTLKITLPASVTEVGDSVFDASPSLQTIALAEDSKTLVAGDDGSLFTSDGECLFKREANTPASQSTD